MGSQMGDESSVSVNKMILCPRFDSAFANSRMRVAQTCDVAGWQWLMKTARTKGPPGIGAGASYLGCVEGNAAAKSVQ